MSDSPNTDFQRKMRGYSRSVLPRDLKAAQAFNMCFSRDGGLLTNRWKYSENAQWYRLRYWEYLRKMQATDLYAPAFTSTYWDFIDNPGLNAIAKPWESYDFVGVYGGTIRNVGLLFDFLMSHPWVLPYIGNSNDEKAWFSDLSACDWTGSSNSILVKMCPAEGFPDAWPKDPERALTAMKLTTLALDFLFFHELGHIASGHTSYTGQSAGVTIIQESQATAERPLITSHVLELQADAFSALFTTTEWYLMEWPNGSPFSSLLEVLTMWVMAVGSLFLLFDRKSTPVSAYGRTNHPHPAVRLLHLLDSSRNAVPPSSDAAAETLNMAHKLALENLAATWEFFGIASAVWEATKSEGNTVVSEYEALIRHYQKIEPDLERIRRWAKSQGTARS